MHFHNKYGRVPVRIGLLWSQTTAQEEMSILAVLHNGVTYNILDKK